MIAVRSTVVFVFVFIFIFVFGCLSLALLHPFPSIAICDATRSAFSPCSVLTTTSWQPLNSLNCPNEQLLHNEDDWLGFKYDIVGHIGGGGASSPSHPIS